MLRNTRGSFPATLQGTLVLASNTGNFSVGETVTGSGFSAKVVKWVSATKTLTVKKVVATTPVTTSLSLTGGTSGATGAVDTVTSTTLDQVAGGSAGGLLINYGGWNLRETDSGIVRTKVIDTSPLRVIAEVLVAQKGMNTTRTDFVTVATFTLTGGAWSAATTYDVSNGESLSFTIKSSEPVRLPEGTTYGFTITTSGDVLVTTRAGVLSASSSDGLTHTFSYPVVAGDIVTGGKLKTVAANFNLNGGTAYEIADNGSQNPITAPISVGGTLADKTGVTIQA